MIINIITDLSDTDTLDRWFTFNMTVAWFLRKAFSKQGVACRLVTSHILMGHPPPKADHTIVLSAIAMKRIRADPKYREIVRASTKGKMTVYLDAAYAYWDKLFDYIFTVVQPFKKSSEKYVYAGWGADPKYCYPEQTEKTLYVDTLNYGLYKGKFDYLYHILEKVTASCDLKVHNPLPRYHNYMRLPWLQIQAILRKCHFFCCTALGESGLLRIEAATCGALLVVPTPLYRYRTMGSLSHKLWNSEAELRKILLTETNPQAISMKARAHSWDATASRIIGTLQK